MNTGDENPYSAPTATELPTPPKVSVDQPGLRKFLLQGLFAALLTTPFNAMYFFAISVVGPTVAVPFYGNAEFLFLGIWVAAVGDGLTAMLCGRIFTNRPRELTLVAAGMGSRILAVLCQGILAVGANSIFFAIPRFMIFSFHFGLPSLFLTMIFVTLLNRRALFWVYTTVFITASIAAYMLNAAVWVTVLATSNQFGTFSMSNAVFATLACESSFLCILAAMLWFSVRVSRPAVTPSSSPL